MSAPLRVLAVDDERLALRRMELLLRAAEGVEVVGQARSGPDALTAIETLRPDVVLLDIKMSGMTGLDVAHVLDEPGGPMVIFATAFRDFAAQAFDLSAVDYVLKPVTASRLERALERARKRRCEGVAALPQPATVRTDPPEARREIWVRRRGEFVRLAPEAIEWVEADRDYVRLHAGGNSYLLRQTMHGMLERLGSDRFVRVRRSALVRRDAIQAIRKTGHGEVRIRTASGAELRVGRTYVRQFRAMVTTLPEAVG
ncbi:MAG: LytTR family DNA-binding domain-containing protein [Pseudomonadota bacterium]